MAIGDAVGRAALALALVLVFALVLVLALVPCALVAGCAGVSAPADALPPGDPNDILPPGPLTVVSAHEGSTADDTVEEVHVRDAAGGEHTLLLHFTSYPIVPTLLTVDDKPVPAGAAWQRLGRRLVAAGLSNNATFLLLCFGGNDDHAC